MASIRKRRWGDGREAWVVDYIDQHGKRRLKTFSTRKAADEWRTTATHEVQQGTHTPASISKTVAEAWQEWIDDCEASGLEKSTVRQRGQHLNHQVRPFIGSIKLSNLTMPIIYDFDCKLRDAGQSLPMRRKVRRIECDHRCRCGSLATADRHRHIYGNAGQ